MHAAEKDYIMGDFSLLSTKRVGVTPRTKAFHTRILEQQLEISVAKNVPRYIVCSRPTMYE